MGAAIQIAAEQNMKLYFLNNLVKLFVFCLTLRILLLICLSGDLNYILSGKFLSRDVSIKNSLDHERKEYSIFSEFIYIEGHMSAKPT